MATFWKEPDRWADCAVPVRGRFHGREVGTDSLQGMAAEGCSSQLQTRLGRRAGPELLSDHD